MKKTLTGLPQVWQLFFGLKGNLLYFQVADRKGDVIHSFEKELTVRNWNEVAHACAEWFENFSFADNFCLIADPLYRHTRDGERLVEGSDIPERCDELASIHPKLPTILISYLPMDLEYGKDPVVFEANVNKITGNMGPVSERMSEPLHYAFKFLDPAGNFALKRTYLPVGQLGKTELAESAKGYVQDSEAFSHGFIKEVLWKGDQSAMEKPARIDGKLQAFVLQRKGQVITNEGAATYCIDDAPIDFDFSSYEVTIVQI